MRNEYSYPEPDGVENRVAEEAAAYEGLRREDRSPRGEPIRGQTIRRERQALRRGLRLALRARLVHHDPIEWAQLEEIGSDPPDERQASKEWTAAQIARVLSKLSAKAKRAGIPELCRFVQLTGLRLEELRRYRGD